MNVGADLGPEDISYVQLGTTDLSQLLATFEKRFESSTPVSQQEIEEMYAMLTKEPLHSKVKPHLDDPQHIAGILSSLVQVIGHGKENQSQAMESTSESGSNGVNGSYFLKDRTGTSHWVFKVADEESSQLGVGIPRGGGVLREHLASLVNFHSLYPIPFTGYVTLFGKTGSIQQFVAGKNLRTILDESRGFGAEGFQKKAKEILQNLTLRDIQAKLIFDIIFGNSDGHESNIICTLQAPFSLHSIDHGNICSNSAEAILLVPYIRIMDDTPLESELQEHCRTLPTQRYSSLMQEHGFDSLAINHMHERSMWLKLGLEQGLSIQEIALPLMLKPELIYSCKYDIVELAKTILTFRNNLQAACGENNWKEVKILLIDLRKGKAVPLLVKSEDDFSRMWHSYIKGMLIRFPGSESIRSEIGATV